MEYFDVSLEGKTYVVRPSFSGTALLLTTEVDGTEIVFKGTSEGLRVIDATTVDERLLEKLAAEIESYLM